MNHKYVVKVSFVLFYAYICFWKSNVYSYGTSVS